MPSLALVQTFFREAFSSRSSVRRPEPDLVMDDPDKVAAFTRAGREDGVMAPVYQFHAAQVSEVIKPGDTVVDLGCGPATQLGLVARLNPEVNFIGVDLSDEMLGKAEAYIQEQSLTNISFQKDDITKLETLADNSADAIFSTVVLHHLPDVEALESTFKQVRRVLKPGGGLYLVDFGHLKSEKSIEAFAYQYADRQPELFTLDYLYSLQAAFEVSDYRRLAQAYFGDEMSVHNTFVMPFMVCVKSATRADVKSNPVREQLAVMRKNMPGYHQADIKELKMFFRLGGLKTALLE